MEIYYCAFSLQTPIVLADRTVAIIIYYYQENIIDLAGSKIKLIVSNFYSTRVVF